jgi:hypothetical protein
MKHYGGQLQLCECIECQINKCIERSYYAATVFSGAALLLFAIVEAYQGLKQSNNAGYDILPIIAVVARVDHLYTIATRDLRDLDNYDEKITNFILLGISITDHKCRNYPHSK